MELESGHSHGVETSLHIAVAGGYTILYIMPTGLRIVGSGEMSHGLEIVMDTSERPPRAIAVGRQPGVVNYFLGADPLRWRRQIPTYAEVRYPRVFPKIDVVYRTDRGHLEFDFALAAGADPDQIRLHLVGAKKIALQGEDLVLHIGTRELRLQQPHAFQVVQGQRVGVSARWTIAGNTASFVLGEYDRARRLVIDPAVSYVTSTSGERMSVLMALTTLTSVSPSTRPSRRAARRWSRRSTRRPVPARGRDAR